LSDPVDSRFDRPAWRGAEKAVFPPEATATDGVGWRVAAAAIGLSAAGPAAPIADVV